MASDTIETAVTEFTEETSEQTGQSRAEKKKETDFLLLQIKKRKRAEKTKVTKLRHELERVCLKDSELPVIESVIEQLWTALEVTQEPLEELTAFYVEVGDESGKKKVIEESETIEKEIQRAIEAGQTVIKTCARKTVNTSRLNSVNMTDSYNQQPSQQYQLNESHCKPDAQSRFLKPLKVPTFDGDKQKFEDFWALFRSLVDESVEPANLKMARLRQCLTGNALEAIRGLGVSSTEYEEAKEILKTKYGGARRLLRAYMDQLEQMPAIRSNDIHTLEKFADLVRITVVKLQAEGKDGELGDGTLHSLMVKKLHDRQLETYGRWLNDRAREKSVIAFRDWLKDEVRFRVEAAEMANGIEPKTFETAKSTKVSRSWKNAKFTHCCNREWNKKDAASLFSLSESRSWCLVLQAVYDKGVDDRWQFAKERKLCFRCLASDHRGKDRRKSRTCGIDGCPRNHHRLLHGLEKLSETGPLITLPRVDQERRPVIPWEGAPVVTMTSCNAETPTESYSLQTVRVDEG